MVRKRCFGLEDIRLLSQEMYLILEKKIEFTCPLGVSTIIVCIMYIQRVVD